MSNSNRKLRREQQRIQQAAVRRIQKEVGKKLGTGAKPMAGDHLQGAVQAVTEVVKGTRNGRCNVTACTSGKPAVWWNRSTRAWYCRDCAQRINIANGDANRLLCITAGEHDLDVAKEQARWEQIKAGRVDGAPVQGDLEGVMHHVDEAIGALSERYGPSQLAGGVLARTDADLQAQLDIAVATGHGRIEVDMPGVKGSIEVTGGRQANSAGQKWVGVDVAQPGADRTVVIIPGSRPGQPTEYLPLDRFRGKARPLEVTVDDPVAMVRGLNRWVEQLKERGGAVNDEALAAVVARLGAGENAAEVLGEKYEAVQQLAYG